jgi:electron transfer flavoprotein alpha subunit
MSSRGKGVFVYSENRSLLLQLLGKGEELARKLGGELSTLVVGSKTSEETALHEHGADIVFVANKPELPSIDAECHRSALIETINTDSPHIVIIGATKRGKELAARLAAILDTGCMTECIDLDVDEEGRLKSKRLTYGGSTIASEISNKTPHIATVAPLTFQEKEPEPKTGKLIQLDFETPKQRVRIVERREKRKEEVDLEEAPIIVSAGRGFKAQDDLRLLEELAEALDAKMGCTRPIAADLGWMDEWIGISGHKVKPKLYVACGVSGTIQHAAGIRDSQIIVSINESETANINELSDYSIVGDLYKVLPALTRALRKRRK